MKKFFSLLILTVLLLNLMACNSNISLDWVNAGTYLSVYWKNCDIAGDYLYLDVSCYGKSQAIDERITFINCSVTVKITASVYDDYRNYYSATGKATMKLNESGDGSCTVRIDLSDMYRINGINDFDISDVSVVKANGTLKKNSY